MAKLKDVAASAGVSIATASRVLNRGKGAETISEDCARRVRKIASELGYHGNYHHRSIRRGRAEMIAFVREIGPPSDRRQLSLVQNDYFSTLIGGVQIAAHEVGSSVALVGSSGESRALARAVNGVRTQQFDGLIIPTPDDLRDGEAALDDDPTLNAAVIQPRVRTVLPTIDFDQHEAMRLAVEHLAGLGHRRVLWLGPEHEGRGGDRGERERLFVSLAWDGGVTGTSCRFAMSYTGDDAMRQTLQRAETALEQRLAEQRDFTAIMCFNDDTAVAAMRAIWRAGLRVPEDVSVVGVDNVRAEMNLVPLTTIDHSFSRMGQRATELVLDMIDGGQSARNRLRGHVEKIAPTLVVRNTTAPPRDSV